MGASSVSVVVFAVAAVCDWLAVARGLRRLEYLCKPAALVALVLAAAILDPSDQAMRAWFVAGLILSVAGDVLLMLPQAFLPGLASFFLAHVAYTAGFWSRDASLVPFVVGLILVVVVAAAVSRPIVRGARVADPMLGSPVTAYVAVLAVMVASAIADGDPFGVAGAGLFLLSDSLIGWSRFVRSYYWAPVTIMVTYHLGQLGLVLSLL